MSITPDNLITSNPFIATQCDQAGEIVMLCDETAQPAQPVMDSMTKELLKQALDALSLNLTVGHGNSTDFAKQGVAYDAAIECIAAINEAIAQSVKPASIESTLECLAATGSTVDSFISLPDAQKRLWFASYVRESLLRKKALMALEEYEHAPSHVGRERCVIEAVAYLSGLTVSHPSHPDDSELDQLRDQNTALDSACAVQDAEIALLRGVLERIARLGNGDNYGNSLGNGIAIAALYPSPKDPA